MSSAAAAERSSGALLQMPSKIRSRSDLVVGCAMCIAPPESPHVVAALGTLSRSHTKRRWMTVNFL